MAFEDQQDLFEQIGETEIVQFLLRELHDDLTDRVARIRYLNDIGSTLGQGGTIIFGGTAAYTALLEARSSFIAGNYMATILLSQALAENTLAGYLHMSLTDLPPKVLFKETLRHCQDKGIVNSEEARDLKRLASLRNPLSHFRNVDDDENLLRRSMITSENPEEILSKDAHFALATITRMLAKAPFRVGG